VIDISARLHADFRNRIAEEDDFGGFGILHGKR
jgi:hypothetical protein